jgi:hypothetical protein
MSEHLEDCLPSGEPLEAGEFYCDGEVLGWQGRPCPRCKGIGQGDEWTTCLGCAGTGEAYGPKWLIEQ